MRVRFGATRFEQRMTSSDSLYLASLFFIYPSLADVGPARAGRASARHGEPCRLESRQLSSAAIDTRTITRCLSGIIFTSGEVA